jgi:hypothetical protein
LKPLIEQVLEGCRLASYNVDHVAGAREKISHYLEKLVSAGQCDVHALTIYALAYLKELDEGPDRRFTGC